MSSAQARTIQIFLPTGEPRGLRIAELTVRIVQAVLIPRSDLAAAKSRAELDHIAVYFLFGESESSAKPLVYIGQTEDVRTRLDKHDSTKEFWQTAVLGISRTHNFTQAHIRWLEWYCVQRAQEVNRFQFDNGHTPGKPFVTEPMEADLLDAFDTLSILLATLGFPLFEPVAKPAGQAELFYVRGKNAEGTGELVEDGFVVRQGSRARIEIVESARELLARPRQLLLDAGVLTEEDGQYVFTQDYLFASPSAAAAAVLGRTANGWVEWKTADGRTLHESRRSGEKAESD